MKLPSPLTRVARQAAATLPTIPTWPSRTEAMQGVMAVAWQYGLRSGLMVGIPGGAILMLFMLWVFV
jgi:hypothetical protein